MNVLFVDDEQAILDALRRTLRKEPYVIHTAVTAKAALEILKGHEIDVVVSDERMPGCSGTDLLAEVSRLFPRTIRIMLTGEAGLDGAVRAINDGKLYRFLNKPIQPDELVKTLQNAFRMRRLDSARRRILA